MPEVRAAVIDTDSSVPTPDASTSARRSAPPRTPWYLTGRTHPEGALQEIAVNSELFTVGRQPDNQLCLTHSTISGHHAELFFVADDLFVRDLHSTNGTLVNGRRVRTVCGLRAEDTIHFGTAVFTIRRNGSCLSKETVTTDILQEAAGHLNFDKLLGDPALQPFFQPIVRLEDRSTVGYEVLARSELSGLEYPAKMFRVAEERGSEATLSNLSRFLGMYAGRKFAAATSLYLNTHPAEFNRPELLDSLSVLRDRFPDAPITVEIHEGSITSPEFLGDFRSLLNELRMSLAYDDFGSGQARLLELIDVPPDVLKFDMKFVRGIADASAERRRMIQSFVDIVRGLAISPLAEGVETAEEAAACRDLGFELAQGYFFGRPRPAVDYQ
jgi:EAL domain-containing protein (putative c-di-GMP-specific phosphodiesterase class I)